MLQLVLGGLEARQPDACRCQRRRQRPERGDRREQGRADLLRPDAMAHPQHAGRRRGPRTAPVAGERGPDLGLSGVDGKHRRGH